MAQALRHADEAEAYTLADAATFHRLARQLELSVHHRGDSYLVNTYAVLHAPADADAAAFAAGSRLDPAGRWSVPLQSTVSVNIQCGRRDVPPRPRATHPVT